MRPRQLSTEELIAVLEKEHESLLATLRTLHDAISREDTNAAFSIVGGIDEVLIQHMIDEEANLLKTLIRVFGREGSMEAIEVFREHVDIDAMIKEMKSLLREGKIGQPEMLSQLGDLLTSHFRKEQEHVFPCVLDATRRLTG